MKRHISCLVVISLLCLAWMDSFGQPQAFQWAQQSTGSGNAIGLRMAQDASNNTVIVGHFNNALTFGSTSVATAGDQSIFVVKYNSSGGVSFLGKLGGDNQDVVTGVATDQSGNIYISGYFYASTVIGATTYYAVRTDIYSGFLVKMSSSGAIVWVKQIGGNNPNDSYSGTEPHDVAVDGAGNITIVGSYKSDIYVPIGGTLLSGDGTFLARFTSSGSLIFVRRATNTLDTFGLTVNGAGVIYLTGKHEYYGPVFYGGGGTSISLPAGYGIWVALYSSDGYVGWARSATGATFQGDNSFSVELDGSSSNNVFISGTFGGSLNFGSTTLSAQGSDGYLAKYDNEGTFQWAKKIGGTGTQVATGLARVGEKHVASVGYFEGTATFDDIQLTSSGIWDAFMCKYDGSGACVSAVKAGGSSFDVGFDIATNSVGDNLATGNFESPTASFGSITLTRVLTSSEVFLAKLVTSIPQSYSNGWCLTSLPDLVFSPSKASVYPGVSPTNILVLNGSTFQTAPDPLSSGVGYWVKFPSAANITYTGSPLYSSSYSVTTGWNLIGSLSSPLPTSKITVSTGSVISQYYSYNGVNYQASTTIEPGRAYWVKVSASATLLLDINSTAEIPPSQSQETPPPPPILPPAAPVLASPENDSYDLPLTLTLSWNASEEATSYTVHVNNLANTWSTDVSTTALSKVVSVPYYYQTYRWKVKASNSAGTSAWSSIWQFVTESGGGGGGGCPYVAIWDGVGFDDDNNILPQTEYPGNDGFTVTDQYKLMKSPAMVGDRYVLEIREFENERSYLDQFELIAVDHSPETDIALLPSGDIVEYKSPFELRDAGMRDQLGQIDNQVIRMGDGDVIDLEYTAQNDPDYPETGETAGGVVLAGWTIPRVELMTGKDWKVGSVIGAHNVVGQDVPFTFRERSTAVFVPVESPGQRVTVQFGARVALDYAKLATPVLPKFTATTLELLTAKHNVDGDVHSDLKSADGSSTVLTPGQSIALEFSAPTVSEDVRRDFILISRGRYEHLSSGRAGIPENFTLDQNYPNPFNPTTRFDYAIPTDQHVTLKVVNTLGQEVATVVDAMQQAGYKSAEFNAGHLPSGMYFYRLKAGDFVSTRKMILIK